MRRWRISPAGRSLRLGNGRGASCGHRTRPGRGGGFRPEPDWRGPLGETMTAVEERLTFEFTRIVVFFLFALITSPVLLFFLWLNGLLGHDQGLRRFQTLLGIFGFVSYLGLGWLAHETARRMVFEEMSLVEAVRSTLLDTRMTLGLIPGVGHWFF